MRINKNIRSQGFWLIALCLFLSNCDRYSKSEKDAQPEFLQKVQELDQFKRMQEHIDSLNQQGVQVELSLEVLENSFFPEDENREITLIFLSEDLGFANSQSYIVKYDRVMNEVVEVIDNRPKLKNLSDEF